MLLDDVDSLREPTYDRGRNNRARSDGSASQTRALDALQGACLLGDGHGPRTDP